ARVADLGAEVVRPGRLLDQLG
ncbi:MAG: hypothetical protein QOC59_1516, partial [Microbacteriaceae bacterium]|nr:hypothetical protein [Microbacteriaceae bacterium]